MQTNKELHPIASKTYITVFVLLIVLTALTLAQPMIIDLNLGSTLSVQLGIAMLKAFLIVAYYMHIKSESILFRTLIYSSLIVLLIVYVIIAIDTYFRFGANDVFAWAVRGGVLC